MRDSYVATAASLSLTSGSTVGSFPVGATRGRLQRQPQALPAVDDDATEVVDGVHAVGLAVVAVVNRLAHHLHLADSGRHRQRGGELAPRPSTPGRLRRSVSAIAHSVHTAQPACRHAGRQTQMVLITETRLNTSS